MKYKKPNPGLGDSLNQGFWFEKSLGNQGFWVRATPTLASKVE